MPVDMTVLQVPLEGETITQVTDEDVVAIINDNRFIVQAGATLRREIKNTVLCKWVAPDWLFKVELKGDGLQLWVRRDPMSTLPIYYVVPEPTLEPLVAPQSEG